MTVRARQSASVHPSKLSPRQRGKAGSGNAGRGNQGLPAKLAATCPTYGYPHMSDTWMPTHVPMHPRKSTSSRVPRTWGEKAKLECVSKTPPPLMLKQKSFHTNLNADERCPNESPARTD